MTALETAMVVATVVGLFGWAVLSEILTSVRRRSYNAGWADCEWVAQADDWYGADQ